MLPRTLPLTCLILLLSASTPVFAGPRKWRVQRTPSFRLLHLTDQADAVVAGRIRKRVEGIRAAQFKLWSGAAPKRPWRPRCDIHVYSNNRDLVRMTGGTSKAGSAQSRPSRLSPGKMLQRRINVAANDRGLMANTLPHEITHVVASDLLAGSVPRWANEGMAVLSEHIRKIKYYDAILNRALAAGTWFPVKRLMGMRRYPGRRHLGLYYAQSTSLVLFFVTLKSNVTFTHFLKDAHRRGYVPALKKHYGITGYADLQRRWFKAARE